MLAKYTTEWDLEVRDKYGKKVTNFGIFDWTIGSPLRSMWGKPKFTDKNGWQHWQ